MNVAIFDGAATILGKRWVLDVDVLLAAAASFEVHDRFDLTLRQGVSKDCETSPARLFL